MHDSRPNVHFPRLAVSLLGLMILPHAAFGQRDRRPAFDGRVSGSAHAQVTEPKGDFGANTGNGFGLGVTGLLRLDPNGVANLRTDLGFITYGSTTRRIDFANTGGLVKLDLETTSSIFSMLGGPQIGGTIGPVSPYIAALGGFSVFWTSSSVEGTNNSSNNGNEFASTTNASDFVPSYGGAAGLTIRVYNGVRPVRIDLGARYLRHDDVSYLNKARVEEAFRNDRDPIPIRSRADFVTYYFGVNAILF